MNLNIIIPMAGESSRFNYKFKPFLYLDNKRFIEHCIIVNKIMQLKFVW